MLRFSTVLHSEGLFGSSHSSISRMMDAGVLSRLLGLDVVLRCITITEVEALKGKVQKTRSAASDAIEVHTLRHAETYNFALLLQPKLLLIASDTPTSIKHL
eukprot:5941028-Pyramimonas_sp.AAC.1